MNRAETIRLLNRIRSAYGRKAADADTVDEWHRALLEADPADADAALDRCIRTGQPGPDLPTILALLPRSTPEDVKPEPRYEPTTTERTRVAAIQADIATQLANMQYRSRR